jgi:NTE family protein
VPVRRIENLQPPVQCVAESMDRVERPLRVPRQPWQVTAVASEMTRRRRFARSMADRPHDVTVRVWPAGISSPGYADIRPHLRYHSASLTRRRIGAGYRASAWYRSVLSCPARRDPS